MGKLYFTIDAWSDLVHLCTDEKESSVCGTHLNFPSRGHQVRIKDEEIEQKWGDDKFQSVKWVKTASHHYCKKCLKVLQKNSG